MFGIAKTTPDPSRQYDERIVRFDMEYSNERIKVGQKICFHNLAEKV